MTSTLIPYLRRAQIWFSALSQREKYYVGGAIIALLFFVVWLPITTYQDYLEENKRILALRLRDAQSIEQLTSRYKTLKSRLDKVQKTFAKSQMTFEQVTENLDQIVKDSIGSDQYDLRKTRDPSAFGLDYEKQDFTLQVKSLSLEQLVDLLYRLEQGESPLFLGRVDIAKVGAQGDLRASIEIFSIKKSKAQAA